MGTSLKLTISLIFAFISVFAYSQNDTIIDGKKYKIGSVTIIYKGEYKQVERTYYNEESTIYQRCIYKTRRKEIEKPILA